jgi:hypothetical protein
MACQSGRWAYPGDWAHVDDGFDFPPTAHPGRELFTAGLFVFLLLALLVWGGWKLISLISAPRRTPHHQPYR